MVSSTEYAVEVYTRNDDKWILSTAKGKEDSLYISAIDYNIKLADVYSQIDQFQAK